MKTVFLSSALAAASVLALTGVAAAESMASATTDLNIRSGPGPEHEVVGVIGASEEATVQGCIESSKWCQVSHDGIDGWAYSDYLTGTYEGVDEPVVLSEWPMPARPVVTYDVTTTTTTTTTNSNAGGTLGGAATGAIAGALIGGPVGAVIGGAAGAAAGGTLDAAVTPPEEVVTYVQENRVDPVLLDGEVVVGAALPDTVEIRKIPDYQYDYVYVNGQPVLVRPEDRTIVYVLR